MRLWRFFLGGLLACAVARADQVMDMARIHLEVIGGKDRIQALTAMRVTGYVLAGGKKLRFTMISARPNRVRLETGAEGRSLIQVSDGIEPPWKFDTGNWPPRYVPMAEGDARIFTADAEFDDPLVAGEERGYTFDYAGEVPAGEKKNLLRILVTQRRGTPFSILLDPETYFIVARLEQHSAPSGRNVQIVTRFDDYRPVAGVLIAHRVSMVSDGKPVQQTFIESVEPNPTLTAETFARPEVTAPPVKKK